ncbi:MAG: MFS transporter [Nanoarchaeota archaeon]|nr:MFS transporter [DPANN group archaeon]MBL7116313.1 MFS transporter [Nanoarchaeota archaeon]
MHYREYFRATGINMLFTFCIFLYYPILSPFVKGLGLDDFQTALVFSILPLAIIFSSPIMGRLADDIGRTRVIILGIMIEISAMALYILGSNWLLIAIARFLDAVAVAGVTLVALAKIEDALSDKERGKYAGWSFSLTHIGAVVAPVVGGILADKLFIRAPFILAAVLLLALAFFLAFRTRKLSKKVDKRAFNLVDELKTFLSIKPLKGMAVLGIVMHATNPAMLVFLPLYIVERLGLSYTYVGIALFFLGITHVFQFYFGSLNDKFGRATMTLFGCFLFALFLFLLSTTHAYWLILLLLLFQGTGGAIWNVSAWTLMSDIGEKINKEGEIVGSYMSIAKMGSFISFLFSGLIVQVFSIEVLFMFNAFLIAIGMLIASFYFDKHHILPKKVAKLS